MATWKSMLDQMLAMGWKVHFYLIADMEADSHADSRHVRIHADRSTEGTIETRQCTEKTARQAVKTLYKEVIWDRQQEQKYANQDI